MVKLHSTLLLLGGTAARALTLPEPIIAAADENTSLMTPKKDPFATQLAVREADTPLDWVCHIVNTPSATKLKAAGYVAGASVTIWMAVLAQLSYNEQKAQNKCALMQGKTPNTGPGGTDGTVYFHIQPYTTSGNSCDTTAQAKTFINAYFAAGNFLHDAGATAGCCTFQHGDGTWHSHVKVKTGENFPFDDDSFTCPPSAHG